MSEPTLPSGLVEARRTPLFDFESLPDQLAESHRTTVWAQLFVQSGTVHYTDLQGETPRDVGLGSGDAAVIKPGIEHRVEPATDATFFIQFYRAPDAPMVPGSVATEPRRRSGPWEHRGRDLDVTDEVHEMVTRQYVDVVQDELLEPYFNFEPGFIDWQAHIESVTDYWCHVLLYAPDYQIDVIEAHRTLHDTDPFTPELLDRWLQIFHDTVDDGWTGPPPLSTPRSGRPEWHGPWPNDSSAKEPGDPPDTGEPTGPAPTHRIASHRRNPELVLTYVTADINCPTCFNQVIETITATPGVHTVDPHVADGCIAITHDLDESVLLTTITTIGHTLDIASNGEITMGQAHATTVHTCDAHSSAGHAPAVVTTAGPIGHETSGSMS